MVIFKEKLMTTKTEQKTWERYGKMRNMGKMVVPTI